MKVKDKLYKKTMFGGQISYVVLAEIKREKSIMYEIECLSCNADCDVKRETGDNCRLLVQKVRGKNYYEYISMVNEDSNERLGSYCFHNENKKPYFFYPSIPEARIAFMQSNISYCDEQIEKAKATIASFEKEKIKYADILESLTTHNT